MCVCVFLANSRRCFTFLWNVVLPCLLGVRGVGKCPPYIWKPLICGYVAAGAFFFQKNGPHISVSPELVGTLPQALFYFQKNGPQIFDMSSG